jgi:outer membrane protein OmpA-like peptidoglycan-associated protein
MSTEKKVLFLFLALIFLIVSCVFTHVDDFKKDNDISAVVITQNDNEPDLLKTVIEKVKSFTSSFSQDTVVEPIKVIEEETTIKEEPEDTTEEVKIEEKVVEETETTKIEENSSVVDNQTTQVQDEEKVVEEEIPEEKIEEKIEQPVTPLITTDERYRRTGSEQLIQDLSKEAQLLQIKLSEYVKKNQIIFKRGSNKITKNSNKTIKVIVKSLEEFPNIKIEVAGHTDAAGGAKLNQRISEKRAISVQKRLVYYGIDKSRITARGYGESIPLVKNSPNGYSKINRRVEFNIVEE